MIPLMKLPLKLACDRCQRSCAGGALWIVGAMDKQEIEALLQRDPFWTVRLQPIIDILHWSKAFSDG